MLLKKLEKDPRSRGTIAEKVKLYNDCNREVAILCNHKRTVGAGHEVQMQKLGDRVSYTARIYGGETILMLFIRSKDCDTSNGEQRR